MLAARKRQSFCFMFLFIFRHFDCSNESGGVHLFRMDIVGGILLLLRDEG